MAASLSRTHPLEGFDCLEQVKLKTSSRHRKQMETHLNGPQLLHLPAWTAHFSCNPFGGHTTPSLSRKKALAGWISERRHMILKSLDGLDVL